MGARRGISFRNPHDRYSWPVSLVVRLYLVRYFDFLLPLYLSDVFFLVTKTEP